MPIPIERLEEAQRPLPDRIVAFLARDPRKAFSVPEIFAGVEGFADSTAAVLLATMYGESPTLRPYREALAELVRAGTVRQARYRGEDHFAITAVDLLEDSRPDAPAP